MSRWTWVGTVSGVAAFAARQGKQVGLLWIDAHGDINTPETSPSGNIHGMPLAALLGQGAKELTGVGIRSLDAGEKNASAVFAVELVQSAFGKKIL